MYFLSELKTIFRDEGVMLFFLFLPIAYPLIYSWIYNNEVVREVPVAVVDNSRSALSREFTRKFDASPDVSVALQCRDMAEARKAIAHGEAYGILCFPHDLESRVGRMEQGHVSVYCDMSYMLTYKAVYQTATQISSVMGTELQARMLGKPTAREEEISLKPLDFDEVPIFNTTGGYGNFILPAVLMLILQQTLVLGIGLSAGTARENSRYGDLVPVHPAYTGIYRIVGGKALCYLMVYAIMGTYLTMVVPRFFSFIALVRWQDLLLMMIPYLLACVFFGMTVSCLVRYRENVMLLMVFISVPLLFMTGVSWPQSDIPGVWQGVSWLFPSTFGVRAFVRMNTLGGTLNDVLPELRILWIQAAAYFGTACLVYGHQLRESRRHAQERLDYLRKKQAVRKALKSHKSFDNR